MINMTVESNEAAIKRYFKIQVDKKEQEAHKIFKFYAAQAMTYFMQVQGSAGAEEKGMFWTNHTFGAVQNFYAKAWRVPKNIIGLTFGNNIYYAKYLEYGHEGRFASFPTLVDRFYPMILNDLKVLYGDE